MISGIRHPLMRYHGGKFRLAPWIMQFFPPHQYYVEPFGGAGGILFQKERCYSEVYNDLDQDVSNVFSVIQNPCQRKELIDLLAMTPYSRYEFELAYEDTDCPIERARRTLIRAHMGFGSAGTTKQKTGFRHDSKRKYSLPSHLWTRYPEQIESFGMRLSGVIIECRPAIDVILQHDSKETLFYVDPPYVKTTRQLDGAGFYRHDMTDEDHIDLLDILNKIQGMVVLSGYDSELYRDRLGDWKSYSTSSRIAAFRGVGLRTEVAWINQQCSERGGWGPLFCDGVV